MKNDLKEVEEYYYEMYFNEEIANRIKEVSINKFTVKDGAVSAKSSSMFAVPL